jgi:TolA-binding protein
MQQAREEGVKGSRKLSHILAHAIHSWRYALWTVLILAAVFLVAYFVYSEWNRKLTADSTLAAEAAQDLFGKWSTEANADKKASLEKDLTQKLDALVAKYPRQYGGQRGLFIRADLRFAKKDWEGASADYGALARSFPKSYLAPIALFNEGVCLEEKGDKDAAEASYLRVASAYKGCAEAPRALFDAARIDEQKGSFEDAQKKYEELDSDYSMSAWTKLAKNRIIALKVEGKLK